ncbi:hypothetical protein ACTXT7_000241 [Hymenolepis weldensis]
MSTIFEWSRELCPTKISYRLVRMIKMTELIAKSKMDMKQTENPLKNLNERVTIKDGKKGK